MRRNPFERVGQPYGARPPRLRSRGRRMLILTIVVVVVLAYLCSTTVSYYVDSLWFGALGYASVFWTRLALQAEVFCAVTVVTFIVLYGAYWALRPDNLNELLAARILVNRQQVDLPIGTLVNLGALILALVIAAEVGGSQSESWTTLVLWWYAPHSPGLDPIFGRSLGFYLFQLPAWELLTGWLTMLAVIVCAVAAVFVGITTTARALSRHSAVADPERPRRGLAIGVAALLLTVAAQVYFGRFDRLFDDHTIFSGVDYTQAHITLAGLLVVCWALVVGAAINVTAAVRAPRFTWIVGSVVPAVACYIAVQLVAWYVRTLIVKPNQLNRERPYIAHNIVLTRRAYDLDRIQVHPFPADAGIEALDPSQNQTTLDNIRLWDWRALQDGLRQIQEIRTYYDFPEIDIDRYQLGGRLREMMLAARELDVQKLPVSSQTWINEKLIYTHGYGVAMTSVNGFTPEGLPELVLKNMPVESSLPDLTVTRPEIYFGELTDTDVYVKTRQREFNYPQGEQNNLASYQGSGGIRLGGLLRRTLIAYDRGDIAKLPFSDDVTDDSRLLMRRNILARVQTLAPFLTFDPDPYIVVASDGKLYWIIDAYTTSDTYPYSRRYVLGDEPFNYIRNSVKVVVDAYTGATTFYVFDSNDPVLGAYRNLFPALFRDESAVPADLRAHVRYPELLLTAQADVYALYHMTDPEVFYNREDLWEVATEVRSQGEGPEDAEANYVLMTLPAEQATEFIDILPFTPANRNNLIGWIGGRSDGAHYGEAVVYNFPKSKLVDGPLQVEARIDQNASISGQLTLWNQQGSHVRRGSLLVIPVGKALLYAQPIYLQAANSAMPELRLVVLALQDRFAYGPTFETAMAALFNGAPSTLSAQQASGPAAAPSQIEAGAVEAQGPQPGMNALIDAAAQDFADYQQLTAAGKLAEAGKKLEALKSTLAKLKSTAH